MPPTTRPTPPACDVGTMRNVSTRAAHVTRYETHGSRCVAVSGGVLWGARAVDRRTVVVARWGSDDVWQPVELRTAFDAEPVALAILDGGGAVVFACAGGEIVEVDVDTRDVAVVGEVVDDDVAENGGVLALRESPDGCAIVVVSPVKVMVMSRAWDLLGEVSFDVRAVTATVSWRGDGEVFAVSAKDAHGTVHGRVIDRDCTAALPMDTVEMQSAGAVLGSCVAWQPRVGGFVCHAGPGKALSFFERNGLRHLRSDFDLEAEPRILAWSVDSSMLAAVHGPMEAALFSQVDIYTRSNYKWYQKKGLRIHGNVVAVCWDEDEAGKLVIVTAEGSVATLRLQSVFGTVCSFSHGTHAAVVDGSHLLVTNFSHGIVPPPMNHGVLSFPAAVDAVCGLDSADQFGVLLASGVFEVVYLPSPLSVVQSASRPIADKQVQVVHESWSVGKPLSFEDPLSLFRFPLFIAEGLVAFVRSLHVPYEADALCLYGLQRGSERASFVSQHVCDGRVVAVTCSYKSSPFLVVATDAGSLVRLHVAVEDENDPSGAGLIVEYHMERLEYAREAVAITDVGVSRGRRLTIVHSADGNLQVVDMGKERAISLSRECSSYCVHEGFLILTTRSHLLYCFRLDGDRDARTGVKPEMNEVSVVELLGDNDCADRFDGAEGLGEVSQARDGLGATRPVDRGSVIVTTLPGDVRLVLQAPRGNIETVAPRPVVYSAVCRLSRDGDYGGAFRLSRQQRIDMNVLVDVDPEAFLANASKFVEQVDKPGHIGIFLTFLHGESKRVNAICDAIVTAIRDTGAISRYVNTLLTALVRKEPPDHSGALEYVRMAFALSEAEGTAALDYLFVLVKNEEQVYGHALGTYDLDLALLVAKSSRMDPADYSRELRDLRGMEEFMLRYTIDLKLERYDSALRHLHACGAERQMDCMALCHEHALYETALDLYHENDVVRKEVLQGYASHLAAIGRHEEAAAVFVRNGDWKQAASSYRDSGLWQLAIGAITRADGVEMEERTALFASVGEMLAETGRAVEAARIRVALLDDFDGAIEGLAAAEEWEVALEIASTHTSSESFPTAWASITELISEGGDAMVTELVENKIKVRDRRNRLGAVRERKRLIQERLQGEDGERHNGDADSDVFSASTASSLGSNLSDVTFASKTSATSLYTSLSGTGALSAAKLEKQAERRRRKASRKRIREGHPREEEYLVGYLRKLVPAAFVRKRVRCTVRALACTGRLEQAKLILSEMTEYVAEAAMLPADVLNTEELRSAVQSTDWDLGVAHVRHL